MEITRDFKKSKNSQKIRYIEKMIKSIPNAEKRKREETSGRFFCCII
jgi:hypothetical protein